MTNNEQEQAKPAEQVKPAEQTDNQKVVDLAEALKAMQNGKAARLIDDGNGFILPGIVSCMPYPVLVEAMRKYALPAEDEIVSAEMLLVNMAVVDNGKWSIRHFRPQDFKQNSRWLIYDDEKPQQETELQKAAKQASEAAKQ